MPSQFQRERARAERAEEGRKAAVVRADALEDRAKRAERQAREAQHRAERLADLLANAGGEVEPLRTELRALKGELEAANGKIVASEQAATSANDRAEELAAQLAEAKQANATLSAQQASLTEKATFYEQAAKESAASLAAAAAAQSAAEQRAAELEAKLDEQHSQHRTELNRITRERDQLQKTLAAAEAQLEAARSGLGGALRRRFGSG